MERHGNCRFVSGPPRGLLELPLRLRPAVLQPRQRRSRGRERRCGIPRCRHPRTIHLRPACPRRSRPPLHHPEKEIRRMKVHGRPGDAPLPNNPVGRFRRKRRFLSFRSMPFETRKRPVYTIPEVSPASARMIASMSAPTKSRASDRSRAISSFTDGSFAACKQTRR